MSRKAKNPYTSLFQLNVQFEERKLYYFKVNKIKSQHGAIAGKYQMWHVKVATLVA